MIRIHLLFCLRQPLISKTFFPYIRQVYAASSTYYGNAPVPYHEDLKFHQSSPYAASKYMGELLMTNYNELHGVA